MLAFVAGSILGLQQFSFGLGMAILIDLTIVRILLVPSAMNLFALELVAAGSVARVFRVKSVAPAHLPAAMRPPAR